MGDIGMAVTLGWHESLLGSNDFKLGVYPILSLGWQGMDGWMNQVSSHIKLLSPCRPRILYSPSLTSATPSPR